MNIVKILSQIHIDPGELDIPTDAAPTESTITVALGIMFAAMGAIAFLVIIIAGLQFVLSRGNPEAAAKARNTIIYAAIGLGLSMLAFTIVRFVVSRIG